MNGGIISGQARLLGLAVQVGVWERHGWLGLLVTGGHLAELLGELLASVHAVVQADGGGGGGRRGGGGGGGRALRGSFELLVVVVVVVVGARRLAVGELAGHGLEPHGRHAVAHQPLRRVTLPAAAQRKVAWVLLLLLL